MIEYARVAATVLFDENADTVNAKVPAADGVPDNDPEDDNDNPDGNAPWVTSIVHRPEDPLNDSCWAYAAPTVPDGSKAGSIDAAGFAAVA